MNSKTSSPGPPSAGGLAMSFAELDKALGFLLSAAQQYAFREFAEAFEGAELTPRLYSILALIAANPDCRQVELGEALGMLQTNLVKRIDTLVHRGLVERARHPTDRRANTLQLTAEGRIRIEAYRRTHAAMTARIAGRLGGADYDRLLDLLRAFIKAEEAAGVGRATEE